MQVPKLFGQDGAYRLVSELGRGGFSTVYKAYQVSLGRLVAIKVLRADAIRDARDLERFQREARAVARLAGHPNIVAIYNHGEHDGLAYLVLEYVDGITLQDRLARPIPAAETEQIIRGVAAGLDHVHAHQLVHRDVKPSNILLDKDGRVLLADFGIAKLLDATTALTAAAIGTPEYMAPEQITGGAVDARTDIYALGIVVYRVFAGRPPFEGPMMSVAHRHVYEPPPSMASAGQPIPPGVEDVVRTALAKDPADRYATAGELAEALSRALRPAVPRERVQVAPDRGEPAASPARANRGIWVGAAILALLLGGAALLGLGSVVQGGGGASAEPTASSEPTLQPTRVSTAVAEKPAVRVETPRVVLPDPTSPPPTVAPTAVPSLAPTPRPQPTAPPQPTVAPQPTAPAKPAAVPQPTPAPQPTSAPTATPLPASARLRDGIEMLLVPPGAFTIGDDADDSARPAHPLELPAFYVDRTEVTNAHFARFVEQAGYRGQGDWQRYFDPANFDPRHYDVERGDHPVVNVTWNDADAYCRWAGKRLPTEAEWEKAARGSDGRRWPWGDERGPEYAHLEWGDESGPEPDTRRVGSLPRGASPYGALDLVGNVWEWTASPFSSYPLDPSKLFEPSAAATTPRVTRGASFISLPSTIEATRRIAEPSATARKDLGFRCIVSAS